MSGNLGLGLSNLCFKTLRIQSCQDLPGLDPVSLFHQDLGYTLLFLKGKTGIPYIYGPIDLQIAIFNPVLLFLVPSHTENYHCSKNTQYNYPENSFLHVVFHPLT